MEAKVGGGGACALPCGRMKGTGFDWGVVGRRVEVGACHIPYTLAEIREDMEVGSHLGL